MLTLANQNTDYSWTFQTWEAFIWLLLHKSLSYKKIVHWQHFIQVCLEWWHLVRWAWKQIVQTGHICGTITRFSCFSFVIKLKTMKLQNLNKEWKSKWQIRPHRIYKLCVTQIFQAYLENFHFLINPALKLEVGFKQVTCFKRSIPAFDQRSKSNQGILEAERSAGQPWKLAGKCVGRTAHLSPARPVNEQRSQSSQLITFPRHRYNRWWSCDTSSSVRRQVSTSRCPPPI